MTTPRILLFLLLAVLVCAGSWVLLATEPEDDGQGDAPTSIATAEEDPGGEAGGTGSASVHTSAFKEVSQPVVQPKSAAQLSVGFRICGRVVGPDRSPIVGSTVSVARRFAGQRLQDRRAVVRGSTDAEGRFSFSVADHRVGVRYLVGAQKSGYRPSDMERVNESGIEITLLLKEPGARLTGKVASASGDAIANASVRLGGRLGWPATGSGGDRAGPLPMETTTDEKGAFAIEDAPAGATRILVRAAGYGPWSQYVTLHVEQEEEVTITLHQGARISGSVTDTCGSPRAGARVTVFGYARYEESRTVSDKTGAFALDGLAAGKVQILVIADGFLPERAVFYPTPGQALVWNPVMKPAPGISGRLVLVGGRSKPLVGWNLLARAKSGGGRVTLSSDDGRFLLDRLQGREYRLFVSPPGHHSPLECDWLGSVRAPTTDLLIRVPDDSHAASVAGIVADADGPVEDAWVLFQRPGLWQGAGCKSDANGRFSAHGLCRGTYVLEAAHPSGAPHVRRAGVEVAATGRTWVGTVRLPATGKLALTTKQGSGPLEDVYASVRSAAVPEQDHIFRIENGQAEMSLPAGSYVVTCYGQDFVWARRPFKVTIGATTKVELTLHRGVQRQLVFPCPEPAWWSQVDRFEAVVENEVGTVRIEDVFERDDLWPFTWWPSLLPGRYRVRVEASGHPVLKGEFSLSSLEASLQPICIPMVEGR